MQQWLKVLQSIRYVWMQDNSETKTEDIVVQYLILDFLENEMENAMTFLALAEILR
jgi:hypothetical protein